MNEICRIIIEPEGFTIDAPKGARLSEILFSRDIHTEAPCGGAGKCGKCRVQAAGALSPLTEQEKQLLSADEIASSIRLACLTTVQGSCEISVPKYSESVKQQILTATENISTDICPRTAKKHIIMPEPQLGENLSEAERLINAVHASDCTISACSSLGAVLKDAKYDITAVMFDSQIIAVEKGDTTDALFGIAFDIGSTTLAGYLTDLNTGALLATGSVMNPQILFGDDLISRINYIGTDISRLQTLQTALWTALSRMTADMAETAGIDINNIYTAVCAGNTCMCHIAMGVLPYSLGISPFLPAVSKPMDISAKNTGLEINPAGIVQFMPSIGGFVGADTVGVILSAIPETDKTVMAVDIGTNGEIVLLHKGELSVCSAAAGPAFEGAGISCGMRGGNGAIDKVYMSEGRLVVHTCGDTKPRGICGSGLIDTVRVLLAEGAIDMTGRLLSPDEYTGSPCIAAGLINGEKGTEFLLAEESITGYPLTLKHSDIRALQLAKGSICAAIKTLLQEKGITEYDLSELIIAGGFGNYLDKESAIAIGLLPQIDPGIIRSAGNAAGAGARLVLMSKQQAALAEACARRAHHLELALSAKYQMNLMDAMMFY